MEKRYSRQTLFTPIGDQGQRKLTESTVLIIGCGALGTATSETLVRAGVKKLIIADRDYVEASNLQRQQLFTEQDAINGTPKVIAAKRRLTKIRSDIEIEAVLDHIDGPLMEQLSKNVHLILDATDNFETRLVINDVAWKRGIPWVYGACVGSLSTVYSFVPGETPCFQCLLPALPAVNETCDTAGIIAPAVQITAAHQSAEALKWLSGNKETIRTKMLTYDCWHNTSVEAGITRLKRDTCETCGHNPSFPALQKEAGTSFGVLCGRDTVQVIPDKGRLLTLEEVETVAKRLNQPYKKTPYFLEMMLNDYRCVIFANGRLLIHGLKDIQQGRKMYHQFFG
ncbi:ThiF family adenylyltransferase [Sporosarcina ureilytica]|uniref:Thiamine biosynthesis protein ThiF n=1 Tax=Sporosarcina ureilytica TaxID=298596 RepID=A0A1D8JJV1_9BACL|nr:ThiF family adenylyltransferase [Sporosarcina ureilytica]AOV08960.1 thiamine biosynthesis protein ThiF [Sporosarcina ureilytica]